MPKWKKPENPQSTSRAPTQGPPRKRERMDNGRTRPPMQNCGTWGDTVYPGCHHTSDPKAPKVTKSL